MHWCVEREEEGKVYISSSSSKPSPPSPFSTLELASMNSPDPPAISADSQYNKYQTWLVGGMRGAALRVMAGWER